MFAVSKSQYLVPFDGSFTIASSSTAPPVSTNESKDYKMKLEKSIDQLQDLERILYTHDRTQSY